MKTAKKPKTAAVKDPADKSKKKVRTRQSGVRGRVLAMLASGPMTSSELVSKGGFSAASLYLNLKALKKDGQIATTRNGRSVSISLTGSGGSAAIEGHSVAAPKAASKAGRRAVVAANVPRGLHEALSGLARRLSPVQGVENKLLVLEQLARTMPAPVASVLQEVIADLSRLSA